MSSGAGVEKSEKKDTAENAFLEELKADFKEDSELKKS